MSFLLNDVKIVIILLASDDQRITLQLHLHGRLLARRVAMNLKWEEGLFRRCDTKLVQFILGIGTVFCLKLGEDQKKKKILCLRWGRVYHQLLF